MRNRSSIFLILLATCFFCFLCKSPTEIHVSTEPTQHLTGRILTAQGQPAAGVTVNLFTDSYNPLLNKQLYTESYNTSTTNISGEYAFLLPNAGIYNLIALGGSAGVAIIESLQVESNNNNQTLPTISLAPGVTIHGVTGAFPICGHIY